MRSCQIEKPLPGETGQLLGRLGFSTPPVSERIAELSARLSVLDEATEQVDTVARSRDLRTVPWDEVREDLSGRRAKLFTQLSAAQDELAACSDAERNAGYWLQALAIERQAYWSAFAQGTLGPIATGLLDGEINAHADRIGDGDLTPANTRTSASRASREIVVKTVGPQLAGIRGGSGATILGDGRIVLILVIGNL